MDTLPRAKVGVVALAVFVALSACTDPEPTYPVASGVYQISTATIDGDCKLDNALRPGPLLIGSVMPAAVVASAVSVDVKVCNHPDDDASCGFFGDAFDFGLARDGNGVAGSQLWGVPGCGMVDYDESLTVAGEVTAENTLALTWTATITTGDPNWMCSGYRRCTSTIEQRMALTLGGTQ
jgi:hypothetical protein